MILGHSMTVPILADKMTTIERGQKSDPLAMSQLEQFAFETSLII